MATGMILADPSAPEPDAVEPTEGELTVAKVTPSATRDAVGRPLNARELLLAGLADATEPMSRGET